MEFLHTPVDQRPQWAALAKHRARLDGVSLRRLFTENPGRAAEFTLCVDGLLLDYSKNLVDAEVIGELVDLAYAAGVDRRIEAMFAGETNQYDRRSRRGTRGICAPHAVREW